MKDFLHHLFLPRESNNHRAKILHHQSLLLAIIFLFIIQLVFPPLRSSFPQVLGIATDISSQELLLFINKRRQEKGLMPLSLNEKLSQAAVNKAKDMLEKNYWAHNSPEGTTPWFFIQKSGYDYLYAGENLARGFTNSEDVVNAWMMSSNHRDNLLSQNYQEVGFAVASGKLLGEETTLVVEMLGLGSTSKLAKEEKPKETITTSITPPLEAMQVAGSKAITFNSFVNLKPLIDSKRFSFEISRILLVFFILVLLLDMVIVERKKIVRFVGHNFDHILFLSTILLIMIVFARGVIL